MKFAILGAGALGTILGAHLSRAGHEVAMIVRGERARVLQRQGLVLNGLSSIKARPTVIDEPKKLLETGTLIIATKAIDSMQALESLRHLRLDNAFSVQNGVLKNELLAKVVRVFARAGCHGRFQWRTAGQWRGEIHAQCLPAHRRGEGGAAVHVSRSWSRPSTPRGVRSVAASNIRTREWSKYAGWIAQFPLAVLTRQITWKFLMDERSAMIVVRIVREAALLAAAMKIELTDMPPLPVPSIVHGSDAQAIEIIRGIGQKFLETSPDIECRRSEDVLRGSRLEYDETLGYALAKARELGVPMPTLDTCVSHSGRGPSVKWGRSAFLLVALTGAAFAALTASTVL